MTATLDTKPYVEPDPLIGYRYIAGTRMSLPRPGGGHYDLAVNSAGIRSDRDYAFERPPGVRRLIVCGDSMAAGQFLSNAQRFSELLERRIPNLEVINLALEGSGTDQQVLLYEHVGLRYEHDLVLLLPFLQNIRRNMVEWREAVDPRTGQAVRRAKPRFEFVDGQLVLRPVTPGQPAAAPGPDGGAGTDSPATASTRLKGILSRLPGATPFKAALYAMVPWEPFPEYRDPGSPEWRLMAALVHRLHQLAGSRPVVLAPTFYASYVQFRMARNYWDRFLSLADPPRIDAIDLLPYFTRVGADGVRCFQDPFDMHFSAYGHLVLADALEAELTRLRLLPAVPETRP
ncbi:MAG: hypothetical protein Q8T13_15110 [Acidobacteriota bacterium]|nr:hypothetical protein [Acidobacteriota bacterium]